MQLNCNENAIKNNKKKWIVKVVMATLIELQQLILINFLILVEMEIIIPSNFSQTKRPPSVCQHSYKQRQEDNKFSNLKQLSLLLCRLKEILR